jgi:lysophospholipase L1-like esterase
MRSGFKAALRIALSLAFVCAAFALTEYSTRKIVYGQLASPSSQTELILDRWAAFRNNPHYNQNGVRLDTEGFRRDENVTVEKPAGMIRIFLLGGSVAYGGDTLYPEIENHWRITNSETIDRDLEKRLNSAFPGKRWEVINAAVKGYFLNQDLALYLSRIRQYRPDYLILLDGVNDIFATLRAADGQDGYSMAGLGDEFNGLTKPGSMSLRFMVSTWLLNNSALYRSIRESSAQRYRVRDRMKRSKVSVANTRPGAGDLTLNEQQRYRAAAGRLQTYLQEVQQIHNLAQLDGTKTLFVLQPQIAVTKKPLTTIEARLFDYWSKLDGHLAVFGFQMLYPQLSAILTSGAEADGYRFLDLTHVFDRATVQTFTDYCHLTPAGNQLVADAIFESIASWAPAGGTR